MGKFLRLVAGIPRMRDEGATPTIYDESDLLVSPVSSGTPYTLPASGNYEGAELEVMLDGQVLEPGNDYSYVGAGPTRTQVEFTFDLIAGDNIRFRKIRGA